MGQLGSGGNKDIFTPYQPDALKNKQIVYASANFYNSVFILGSIHSFLLARSPDWLLTLCLTRFTVSPSILQLISID